MHRNLHFQQCLILQSYIERTNLKFICLANLKNLSAYSEKALNYDKIMKNDPVSTNFGPKSKNSNSLFCRLWRERISKRNPCHATVNVHLTVLGNTNQIFTRECFFSTICFASYILYSTVSSKTVCYLCMQQTPAHTHTSPLLLLPNFLKDGRLLFEVGSCSSQWNLV